MLIGCAAQRVQSRWCAETLCMEKSSTHGREDPAGGTYKEKPLLISFGVIQDHLYGVRRTQHENEKSSAKKAASVEAQHPPWKLIFTIKFLRYLWKDLLTSF